MLEEGEFIGVNVGENGIIGGRLLVELLVELLGGSYWWNCWGEVIGGIVGGRLLVELLGGSYWWNCWGEVIGGIVEKRGEFGGAI